MKRSIVGDCWYLTKVGTLFLLLCLSKSCETLKELEHSRTKVPLVLLISLDGFRFDYLNYASTPVLDSLVLTGVKAKSFIPVFPSKTFPNHYTQVTGLYPEHHGIISNYMFDKDFDEYFEIGSNSSSVSDGKWYGGEPIWVTAKRHNLVAANMFWPGSSAQIDGIRPDHYFPFNSNISESDRVSQVVTWLGSKDRPHIITLYFELIDGIGHLHGPSSQLLVSSITRIDNYLGQLMNAVGKLGLSDVLDIIIVSDHGMTELSRERVIFLDEFIDLTEVKVINWSPMLKIIPDSGRQEMIFKELEEAHKHLQVFKKSNTKKSWRFSNHRRITPIVAVADLGWSITSSDFYYKNPRAFSGGAHGYDPEEPAMHGIFIATGPSFKQNTSLESVESVHLYELLCHLLSVEPAQNDGNLEAWTNALAQ